MQSYDKRYVSKPGGVSNVASQFKYFNVDVELITFCDDYLSKVIEEYDFVDKSISIEPNGFIPIKRRYIDGDVQVVRHDVENLNYNLSEREITKFQIEALMKIKHCDVDVIVFSDYNKGFFSDEINWIKNSSCPTIVDPKKKPLEKWEGCTIFKPNYKEAIELTGYKNWRDQCQLFKDELGCEAVVITFGGDGVRGYWEDYFEYKPSRQVKVRSVVGAGDCFLAGLSLCVAHEIYGIEAVATAYEMGAQYVQHGLNRAITPGELAKDKFVEPVDLVSRDYKLVFTNGCFDILHTGHLQTLKFAKSKGDKLVVALNSDESVKRLKGDKRPIKTLKERMSLMAAFEMVDFVTYFEEDTPQEILEIIRPDAIVKGSQYESDKIVGHDFIKEVYRAPMVEGLSTTSLLAV
ncbi:MAG: PfkB family carbohydrate kinase [Bacteroidia bacterium]